MQKRQTDNAHQGALFQKQKRRKMKNLSSSRRTNSHRKIFDILELRLNYLLLTISSDLAKPFGETTIFVKVNEISSQKSFEIVKNVKKKCLNIQNKQQFVWY